MFVFGIPQKRPFVRMVFCFERIIREFTTPKETFLLISVIIESAFFMQTAFGRTRRHKHSTKVCTIESKHSQIYFNNYFNNLL